MEITVRVHAVERAVTNNSTYTLSFPRAWGLVCAIRLHESSSLAPGETELAKIHVWDKSIRVGLRPGDLAGVLLGESPIGRVEILFDEDGSLLGSLPEPLPQIESNGALLPALLLGYDGLDPCTDGWESVPEPLPRWLVTLEHQVGGYACLHKGATGAYFPLRRNADQALQDPTPLFQLAEWLAEDPDRGQLRSHYPELRNHWETSGAPYGPKELEVLQRTLSPYFDLPPFTEGLEALVKCDGAATDAAFVHGWRMLNVEDGVELVDCLAGSEVWSDGPRFGPSELSLLRLVGRSVFGVERGPRLFFIWENSD